MTMHQHAPNGEAPDSEAGTFQGFSLPEAARLLGVSRSSVRRMVRDGRLEARQVLRPQGYAWEVRVPPRSEAPDMDTLHAPGSGRSNAPRGAAEATGPEAIGAWLVPILTPILAPIVAELQATREAGERKDQMIVSQAQQLISQAETIGRTTAELERTASAVVALNDQFAAADRSRQVAVRRLSLALAMLCALLLVAGTLATAGWGWT